MSNVESTNNCPGADIIDITDITPSVVITGELCNNVIVRQHRYPVISSPAAVRGTMVLCYVSPLIHYQHLACVLRP